MEFPSPIPDLVERLATALRADSLVLATVESCTGGLLGGAITTLAGSSDFYAGGFVTYTNALKQSCVGVRQSTLDQFGAVSTQTALEMAVGGAARTGADLAISITGIAGPGGGSEQKPVGTVWICVASNDGQADTRRFLFPGDRAAVRAQSVAAALSMAIQRLCNHAEALEHER